jgi:hypothetical protein
MRSRLLLTRSTSRERPFQVSLDVSLEEGSPGTRETVVTVPRGHLLIVEFVSASIEVPAGQFLTMSIDINHAGRNMPFVFHLLDRQSHSPAPGEARDVAGVNRLVRIYAESGDRVDVATVRVPVTGTGGGTINVVGTLRRTGR